MVAYSVATKKKNITKHNQVNRRRGEDFNFPLSSVVGFMLFLSILLGVLYIARVNKLATMGYEIKERENMIVELNRDNEALKIRAAELRSMHQLELKMEEMKLEKPQDVGYLELDESVAMGR